VLSPELALVDPELRRAACALPPPAAPLPRFVPDPIAVAAGSARLAWLVGAALVVATTGAFASGSSAHQRPAAAPQAASVARAANSAPLPRRWVWPRVKQAALYRVSFVRAGRTVFVAWPAAPPLVLGAGVRFAPGTYEWRVRPVFWRHGRPVVALPVVRSRFTVGRANRESGASAASNLSHGA
jgi:hypothetical protein